ncbi:MAG: hypothetical protein EHM61_04765 [Acidobacteria bacterium]|nr:MAG: hypothetical protein EHM61_04765 [Acidobacteriota bacterium]
MKNQSIENQADASLLKGFCTFCMGSYEPLRMGAHVRRCRDRKDDADCIQTNGQEHPMAFLLMIGILGWPGAWLCLEAHSQASLSDLEFFIRHVWFPETKEEGMFLFQKRAVQKRFSEGGGADSSLDEILKVKDHFCLVEMDGKTPVQITVDVAGHLPTAIMHRPIDVVAFPLDNNGGRMPAGGQRS